MGYCMSMNDSTFFVPTENTGRVLAVMQHQPYELKFDDNGDIVDISFYGDKLGNDLKAFQKIAPFVQDGSFIEMEGEDNETWRWVFKNGKCREVKAKVSVTWEE